MTFVEGVVEVADAIVYTFCPFFNMGTNHMARAKRGLKMSGAGEGQEVLHGTPGTAKRHSQRMSRHVADRQGVPVRANPH